MRDFGSGRSRTPPRILRSPEKSERLLKGPVPLLWLETAARLPGKSLHAGIALWYAAGLARSTSVPLSNISGLRFGLGRNSKYRALAWLEGAELISVEQKLGRVPVVTIRSVISEAPGNAADSDN